MTTNKYEIIERLFKENSFKRCLEFGTGKSTGVIRNLLPLNGTLISLENEKDYYEKSIQTYPNTNNSKIENVSLRIKKNQVQCSYQLEGIYDFVFVDWPNGKFLRKNQIFFKQLLNKHQIDFRRNKYGFQSFWILDYIWNHINENSIVLIDHRMGSVYLNQKLHKIKIEQYGILSRKKVFKKLNIGTASVIKKIV